MIYSSLNSVIQFICAIYVTIVFDSTLFRRFWAPDYYLILQKQIRSFNLPITKDLNQWLTNKIKYRNSIFQEHSRKRGTIFLYTSLVVLVSIAVWEPNQINLTFPFLVLLTCSYIVLLLMPACLNRWIWLIFALVIESCIFFGTIYWPTLTLNPIHYVYKIRLGMIVLLSIPIFYQIIKSWCYSTAMKCFVVHEINKISKDYAQASRAIKNQDKTLIPESYQPIFSGMAFDHPNGNIQLTQINQHVVSVLELRFDDISIVQLLKAYWKNPEVEQQIGDKILQDETQKVSQVKQSPHQSSMPKNIVTTTQYSENPGNKTEKNNEILLTSEKQNNNQARNQTNLSSNTGLIAAAYQEYEDPGNKIKNIDEFCKVKRVNKKAFREYRKTKLKEGSPTSKQKKTQS